MKLHIAISFFLISFNGYALTNQLNDMDDNATSNSGNILAPMKTNLFPGFSIALFLPLVDDAALSSIMTKSQMEVTPGSTYTVRAIQIKLYNPPGGRNCNTGPSPDAPIIIDNGVGNTVTLSSGHTYVTTDASNFAVNFRFGPSFSHYTVDDSSFQFLDNDLNPIGNSGCANGTNNPATCSNSTNCGWNTIQTWTP